MVGGSVLPFSTRCVLWYYALHLHTIRGRPAISLIQRSLFLLQIKDKKMVLTVNDENILDDFISLPFYSLKTQFPQMKQEIRSSAAFHYLPHPPFLREKEKRWRYLEGDSPKCRRNNFRKEDISSYPISTTISSNDCRLFSSLSWALLNLSFCR